MPDFKISEHLPWLVPVIFSLVLGYANIYSLQETVEDIKNKQDTVGYQAYQRLSELEYRVENLEKYCCGDKIK